MNSKFQNHMHCHEQHNTFFYAMMLIYSFILAISTRILKYPAYSDFTRDVKNKTLYRITWGRTEQKNKKY